MRATKLSKGRTSKARTAQPAAQPRRITSIDFIKTLPVVSDPWSTPGYECVLAPGDKIARVQSRIGSFANYHDFNVKTAKGKPGVVLVWRLS